MKRVPAVDATEADLAAGAAPCSSRSVNMIRLRLAAAPNTPEDRPVGIRRCHPAAVCAHRHSYQPPTIPLREARCAGHPVDPVAAAAKADVQPLTFRCRWRFGTNGPQGF